MTPVNTGVKIDTLTPVFTGRAGQRCIRP